MEHRIKELLKNEGISLCAALPLSLCTVNKPYLLEKAKIADGTVMMFAVPYYTTFCDDIARNISVYAVSKDYHLFFKALFDKIISILNAEYPDEKFAGFADHSPISEGEAAVKAGLGMFGKNHLFLTEQYSSFVFLGEIITSAKWETAPHEIKVCRECGLCQKACPVGLNIANCVSALTQKKGDFTQEEEAALLSHGIAWGCDRCQEACAVTKAAKKSGSIYTDIPFFKETALPHLTSEAVEAMPEEEFKTRAFSWRGRNTVLRNLKLLEKRKGNV